MNRTFAKLEKREPMAKIHHAAAQGFAAGAANYVAGRPEYPPEIETWLNQELGLDSSKTVLDLGAGTGKFSRSLLATGAKVIAVEPVPAMLEQLVRQYPEVEAQERHSRSHSAGRCIGGRGRLCAVLSLVCHARSAS